MYSRAISRLVFLSERTLTHTAHSATAACAIRLSGLCRAALCTCCVYGAVHQINRLWYLRTGSTNIWLCISKLVYRISSHYSSRKPEVKWLHTKTLRAIGSFVYCCCCIFFRFYFILFYILWECERKSTSPICSRRSLLAHLLAWSPPPPTTSSS